MIYRIKETLAKYEIEIIMILLISFISIIVITIEVLAHGN